MSDGKKGRPTNAWMGKKRGERAALLLRGLICDGNPSLGESTPQVDWVDFFLEKFRLVYDPDVQKGAPNVTPFFREVVSNLEELSKAEPPEPSKLDWSEALKLVTVPQLFSLLHASLAYLDTLALETLDDSFLDGYWHPYYGENCASSVRQSLMFADSSWQAYDDPEVLSLKSDEKFRKLMDRIQEAAANLAYLPQIGDENSPVENPSVIYHDVRVLGELTFEFNKEYLVPLQKRRRVVYLDDSIDETQRRQIKLFALKKRTGLTSLALACNLAVSEDDVENSMRRVKKFLDDLVVHDAFEINNLDMGHYRDFQNVIHQLWLLGTVSHLRKQ